MEGVDEDEDRRVLVGRARSRARVALDHALGREEGLDLLAQFSDAVVLLLQTANSVSPYLPPRKLIDSDSPSSTQDASRRNRDTAA